MDTPMLDIDALEELTYGQVGIHETGLELVSEPEIVGETRWALIKRLVFTADGKFYAMTWRHPATEMQEEEFEPEVVRVYPHERIVTVYEPTP